MTATTMIKVLTRLFVAGVVATYLHAAAPASAEEIAVKIGNFTFGPHELKVKAGTTVTWTNEDDITHTVTSGGPGSPDGRFDVPLAGKGASGSATFVAPGVYPYFCARHQSMRGEVVVR